MEERKNQQSKEVTEIDGQEITANTSRRRVLKTIVAGSAVVTGMALGKWSRPVVDTVILPAHAQATNATDPASTTAAPTTAAPTTTNAPNSCTSKLGKLFFTTHRDGDNYYDQPVTLSGTVEPPAAGLTIQVHLGLWYDGATDWVYTDYSPTTNATGSWSVTNSNYQGAYAARAEVTGPCDSTDTEVITDGSGVL